MDNLTIHAYCDYQGQKITEDNQNKILEINPESGYHINIEDIKDFSNDTITFDMIKISLYLHIANTLIHKNKFVNEHKEKLNLKIYISVFELESWDSNKENLTQLLRFLTGFELSFNFTKYNLCKKENIFLKNLNLIPNPDNFKTFKNKILLISGGIDSLYGLISKIEYEHVLKRSPIKSNFFLLHYNCEPPSYYKEKINFNYTKDLETNINIYNYELSFLNWSHINVLPIKETQGSFEFFLANIALSLAIYLKAEEIFMFLNGVDSYNLIEIDENIMNTNYIRFLTLCDKFYFKLIKNLYNNSKLENKFNVNNFFELLTFDNQLIWETKGEIVETFKNFNKSELLSDTYSCINIEDTTHTKPFCGICYKCINRRMAIEWAKINEEIEPRNKYARDIISGPLNNKLEFTRIKNYYRQIKQLNEMSFESFCNYYKLKLDNYFSLEYLFENGFKEYKYAKDANLKYEIHKRHSEQVLEVINKKYEEIANKDNINLNSLIGLYHQDIKRINIDEIKEKTDVEKIIDSNTEIIIASTCGYKLYNSGLLVYGNNKTDIDKGLIPLCKYIMDINDSNDPQKRSIDDTTIKDILGYCKRKEKHESKMLYKLRKKFKQISNNNYNPFTPKGRGESSWDIRII